MKAENTAIRLKRLMEERNLKQIDILESARPFCDKYGVTLNVTQEVDSTHEEGTIIKQSRAKGFTVMSGTTFTITVAAKPEEPECNPIEEVC